MIIKEKTLFLKSNVKDSKLIENHFFQFPFYRIPLVKPFVILPSDLIKVGGEIFQIQRLSTGISQDIGSKKTMEDIIIHEQIIPIESVLKASAISIYAIFDG
jgi:hypothetical protein